MENNTYPGSYYQPLFDLLNQEHGITPLESEMADIIVVVEKMRGNQPGPRWVKASDRLPGYNQMVKWRQDGGQATPGTSSLLDIRAHLSCLSQWEWLDESATPAAGREEAIAFADWGNSNVSGFDPVAGKWVYGKDEGRYTTAELYDIFKNLTRGKEGGE